jgi:hypothetical protein
LQDWDEMSERLREGTDWQCDFIGTLSENSFRNV